MNRFVNCNLASRVETGLSTHQEFGLHLYDLVLVRCQQIAKDEISRWHKRIVDAHGESLSGDRNSEDDKQAGKSRAWWDTNDDGYVFSDLSRHLASSDQSRDIEFLFCDIRWTMRGHI